MHQVGDQVRCANGGGWGGVVVAVECMVCGLPFPADRCPAHKHAGYMLTIAHVNRVGDPRHRRPWCLPKNFPLVLWIVIPPRRGRGLRHAVVGGRTRTLCGTRVELWKLEHYFFDRRTIGCKRCKRALGED